MDSIAIKHNDQIIDLQTAAVRGITGEAVVYDNSAEALEVLRHSCAHLMAQAIKALYTDAKFFVGPVVKEGFYYDFKVNETIGEEDLKSIEKKMLDIAKSKVVIERYEITKDEARIKFANDHLKQTVMDRIPDDVISIPCYYNRVEYFVAGTEPTGGRCAPIPTPSITPTPTP